MIRLFLLLFPLSAILSDSGFPTHTLIDCGISNATIDGVQGVIEDHSSMIQLAKSNKRAKKTEIDSMKADIDLYMEENVPEDDKQKWIDCVMKKSSTSL
ncbi:unnamed protein product [Caenorhabditis sp. 36 PRJEB53466]|nr:unnamed protein product [Caenorhabditis sp. 36 PRJEB53466]